MLLVFTQGYPPDPMSVGQHIADVCAEMVRRGHRVVVLTANRGYDDPRVRYPASEVRDGVEVRRLPLSSFGKQGLSRRVAAASLFLAQCAVAGIVLRDVRAILTSTVPPLTASAALAANTLRGIPLAYWVMDMNPEQLVALGRLSAQSPAAVALDRLGRVLLSRASLVVTLDRFMAARLEQKVALGAKLFVAPPWPHEAHLAPLSHEENPWRREHDLEGRFVFMYSGNHSPSNPLRTLLDASLAFRGDDTTQFLFVGGGQGKPEVEAFIREHSLSNVRSLPYEPLDRLRFSLSAADVHMVSLGDPFVGVIHPCKAYGAMAVARPVLFLGPRPSHLSELLDRSGGIGWRVAHGDVAGTIETMRRIRGTPSVELASMGERARATLGGEVSQARLCGAFCDRLEAILR
jgi:hypothetical protein